MLVKTLYFNRNVSDDTDVVVDNIRYASLLHSLKDTIINYSTAIIILRSRHSTSTTLMTTQRRVFYSVA